MEKVNKKGRTNIKGRAVGSDLMRIVVDDILSAGGCSETTYFQLKGCLHRFTVQYTKFNTPLLNIPREARQY